MKSHKSIKAHLANELFSLFNQGINENNTMYQNELLGDSTYLIATTLQYHLVHEKNWDPEIWFDDSLIEKVTLKNKKLTLSGVMIWGTESTTEQWTEPFEFFALFNQLGPIHYELFYSNSKYAEITYNDFAKDRGYWKRLNPNWEYHFMGNF